ncbi:MAG: 23S rRNA (adenine(2503)-C(2))-methyltransferase RlmN [Myxococcales bacterium]|nr:23S rRNA (adenine(2503)-C(2))-methyltransferase RlmN [Myxococcales bacterium]
MVSITLPDAFHGVDFLSLPRLGLAKLLADAGEPPFRAAQVFRWLHGRLERDVGRMTDLPAALRERLARGRRLDALTVADERTSADDGSSKLVLCTQAGHAIESVLMPMAGGDVTQCLSSQVGCKMGCDFCATARIATRANLTAGEIVEQVAIACRLGFARGGGRGGVAGGAQGPLQARPHNLVFMGMGEPLDNLDALLDALEILCDPMGYDFSPRRITVSTVGLAKFLPRLVAAQPAVNVAWSLTATTDAVRDRLMPVNRGVPIARMVEVLQGLPARSHRKITFEYALLDGVNATLADAARLGDMARTTGAHVNVIPFNAWPGTTYRRPPRAVIRAFVDEVVRAGASVSLRESKGQDIGAACGQLATESAAPG